jgi:hypothetical protein
VTLRGFLLPTPRHYYHRAAKGDVSCTVSSVEKDGCAQTHVNRRVCVCVPARRRNLEKKNGRKRAANRADPE